MDALSDAEKRERARRMARELMDSARERNARWYASNPDKPRYVTDDDYASEERRLYEIACGHMGIKP